MTPLALPVVFLAITLTSNPLFLAPTAFLVGIGVWMWLWFRPTWFVVHLRALEIVWPLRRREIPRDDIAAVRLIDREELRREVGRGTRVAAGGLWGGFGWLWTRKRGLVRPAPLGRHPAADPHRGDGTTSRAGALDGPVTTGLPAHRRRAARGASGDAAGRSGSRLRQPLTQPRPPT